MVSCSSEPKTDKVKSVFDEEVVVYLPDFGSDVSNYETAGEPTDDEDDTTATVSRGLTHMRSKGTPFVNEMDATNIMTSLPFLVSFDSNKGGVDDIKNAINNKYGNEKFKVMGYGIEFDSSSLSINEEDGSIALRFFIWNLDKAKNFTQRVGAIDYIYSVKEKKFSYRQLVMLTLNYSKVAYASTTEGYYMYAMQCLQYNDISFNIDENGKASFSFGQYKDGVFENNAFVDFSYLPIGVFTSNSLFCRNYIVGIMDSDGSYYATLKSGETLKNADDDYVKALFAYSFIVPEGIYKPKGDGTTAHDMVVTYTEAANKLDLAALTRLLPLVYKNGTQLANYINKSEKYTSMSNFNASTLDDVNFAIENKGSSYVWGSNPVAFNYNSRMTASMRGGSLGTLPSHMGITKDGLEATGFDKFGYTKTDANEFLEEHLQHCGFSGEGLEKLKREISSVCQNFTY